MWIFAGGAKHDRQADENMLSHSLDRIRLAKVLQKRNSLNQLLGTDLSRILENGGAVNAENNVEKELSREKADVNGAESSIRRSSDGVVLEHYTPSSNKVVHRDELPIKSTKSTNYDDYAPSEPAIPTRLPVTMVRKSFSHQNLASTSKVNGSAQVKKHFRYILNQLSFEKFLLF
ncbi:unnamed protein product [Gongylonema pulchrum]|uniref:Uncharacterized protein n=1 Tax=Gongylonema pulchrum TaxID=637853 RepID=A0A183D1Q8_9BILA|nr:unnamed protein product [Gongylonema pulchrum]